LNDGGNEKKNKHEDDNHPQDCFQYFFYDGKYFIHR